MEEHDRATEPDDAQPVLRSFLEAVDDRVLPTTVSKPALIELSHALEDLVVTDDLAGTVIAGFQRSRFWAAELERYEALATDPRRRAIVFTADEGEGAPGVQRLVVGADHPVGREWFVITLTNAFSAVLFGRELSRSDAPEQGGRQFLTVWSCDRSVVDDLLTVLGAALGDSVPGATAALAAARAAHPPRDPAAGRTQRFATAFFERLELVSQRTLALQAELADARRLLAGPEHAKQGVGPGQPAEPSEPSAAGAGPPEASPAGSVPVGSAAGPGPVGGAPDAVLRPAAVPDVEGVGGPARQALVLHNDPALRGLLEALLRRSGWDVTAGASLDRGLEAATMATFDAILVDAGLVDGAGTTLLDELERVHPGAQARTAFVADEATTAEERDGRPVVTTPLVWRELESVLDALTTTL